MPVLPNQRWELFAVGVAKGQTLADAYEAAGYKRNYVQPTLLAKRPIVAARIEELKTLATEAAQTKVIVTKSWVIQRLTDVYKTAMELKQLASANRSLELMGKELGMFVDRKDIRIDHFSHLSDEALLSEVIRTAKELAGPDTIEGEYSEVEEPEEEADAEN